MSLSQKCVGYLKWVYWKSAPLALSLSHAYSLTLPSYYDTAQRPLPDASTCSWTSSPLELWAKENSIVYHLSSLLCLYSSRKWTTVVGFCCRLGIYISNKFPSAAGSMRAELILLWSRGGEGGRVRSARQCNGRLCEGGMVSPCESQCTPLGWWSICLTNPFTLKHIPGKMLSYKVTLLMLIVSSSPYKDSHEPICRRETEAWIM